MTRPSVLFLCTGNSCRSQMAEGLCRALHGDSDESASAGIVAQGLNPDAVLVMAELNVDISQHRSKTVDELSDTVFDLVITVCGNAAQTCPLFPGATRVLHCGFDDPPELARTATDREAALDCYRRVRNEIHSFMMDLPKLLEQP